jgi:hypothetical protein
MAVSRRTSTRTTRGRSKRRRPNQEGSGETKVSFIGEEIEQAIRRIKERGDDLPRSGRLAVRLAAVTLRLCKLRIKASIGCGAWGIKG